MKEGGTRAGVYVVAIVVLFAYFAWIMDRMAAFSDHGFPHVERLGAGIGIVVLAGVVLGLLTLAGRRRRPPRRPPPE